MKSPGKALFIQLRRIGDVLMCTPSIRAFKKQYPDCRLDFLTELPDALTGNPHIENVIEVDRAREFNFAYQYKLIRKIRSARYDLVVDFFANPRSAYYSYLSGAATRLSYGYGHRRWAYNLVPEKVGQPLFAALDKLQLLSAIDIPPDGPMLEFYPSDDDRAKAARLIGPPENRPLITLSPVSRRPFRRWPLENYAALADLVAEKYNARILALAGPGEEVAAEKIAALAITKIMTPKISSLGLLGAIFENSGLHIGNDNGPKHIAVACGAPTITIFGPHSPVSWTYPDPGRHMWVGPEKLCDDCGRKKKSCVPVCIESISVDTVWEKILEMEKALSKPGSLSEKR